ncbi:hypothetical protein [Saccharopolyspora spinosa]|nr:hypothetical protein [Saccharopolyspora spinosa]
MSSRRRVTPGFGAATAKSALPSGVRAATGSRSATCPSGTNSAMPCNVQPDPERSARTSSALSTGAVMVVPEANARSGSGIGQQEPSRQRGVLPAHRRRTPVFGFTHSTEVVAIVCASGGLGVCGATRSTPTEIEAGPSDIRDCIRDRIRGRPFGIDLVLPKGMPERDDRAAIEAEIPDEDRDFVADLRVPLRRP